MVDGRPGRESTVTAAKRMLRSALVRMEDADVPSRALRPTDSAALLRILALEILMKCALRLAGTAPPQHHNYPALWRTLPRRVRDEVMSVALQRMPGHVDLSNPEYLLGWYRFVFEKARYPYEQLEGYSEEETRQLSELWASLGAPVEEALVRYYPSELICLLEGFKAHVDRQLGAQ